MKTSALPYWLALMVLIAGAYGAWKWWQVKEAQAARSVVSFSHDEGPPLTDFELTERSGKSFRPDDLRGKVWVASFFFASCPGSCRQLNTNIQVMHDDEALRDVHWLSITVDPLNDTLKVLREYADQFGADPQRWFFCRGDFPYVQRVGKDIFKLSVGYHGRHSDHGVVIDRSGNARGTYDINIHIQRRLLKEKLLECLAEEAEPVGVDVPRDIPRGLPPSPQTKG